MDKQLPWLLLLAGVLMVVFMVQYAGQNMGALIFAGEGDFSDFTVSVCSDGKTIYGWGNKNIGLESVDFGCFNAGGDKIAGVETAEDCRAAVCRLGY